MGHFILKRDRKGVFWDIKRDIAKNSLLSIVIRLNGGITE